MQTPPAVLQLCLLVLLLFPEQSVLARRSSSSRGSSKSKSPSSSHHDSSSSSSHHDSSSSSSHHDSSSSSSHHDSSRTGSTHHSKGGYPVRDPAGRYPGQAGHAWGQVGQPVGRPAGAVNWNSKNPILSPRYGHGGGFQFPLAVEGKNFRPSARSKGFAKMGAMLVGVGAGKRVAVNYGLGRFPHPPFSFHSHQEERHYNHYMHRRYGSRSTDSKDYGRDYQYTQPDKPYDDFMDSCMKRPDLLEGEKGGVNGAWEEPQGDQPITATNGSEAEAFASLPGNGSFASAEMARGAMGEAEEDLASPRESSEAPGVVEWGEGEVKEHATLLEDRPPPDGPATGADGGGEGMVWGEVDEGAIIPEVGLPPDYPAPGEDEENDTVSMVEIGYPELVEQLKVRKCIEEYMDYSHSYMERLTGAALSQHPLWHGGELLLSAILTLLTSSVLLQ